MTLRTVYTTNLTPNQMDAGRARILPNEAGHVVAIGAGSDGRFSINVVGRGLGYAYAIVTREELRLIGEAIMKELKND